MDRREFLKGLVAAAVVAHVPVRALLPRPEHDRISAAHIDKMMRIMVKNRAQGPYKLFLTRKQICQEGIDINKLYCGCEVIET